LKKALYSTQEDCVAAGVLIEFSMANTEEGWADDHLERRTAAKNTITAATRIAPHPLLSIPA
jgi:hypothetical protein